MIQKLTVRIEWPFPPQNMALMKSEHIYIRTFVRLPEVDSRPNNRMAFIIFQNLALMESKLIRHKLIQGY